MENDKMYITGVIDSPPDERDYNYGDIAAADPNIKYPEEFRLDIPEVMRTYNQGQTNMCVSFSMSSIKQQRTKSVKRFSPLSIYGNRGAQDYPGMGMIPRQAAAHVVNDGIAFFEDLSEIVDLPKATEIFNSRKNVLFPKMAEHKAQAYFTVNSDDIKRYLITEKVPLFISIPVYDSFMYTEDGIVDHYTGKYHGGHGIGIYGWTKEGRWIILNSWGENWGDRNIGYLSQNLAIKEIIGFTDKEIILPEQHYTLYRVQCGAFKNLQYAQELGLEIINKGVPTCLYYNEEQKLYRVQCGAYKIKANAVEMQKKLVDLGYKDCFIASVEV